MIAMFNMYSYSLFTLLPKISDKYCLSRTLYKVYLGFSYLGCGVSLHSCSSKAQLLLLTLDEG